MMVNPLTKDLATTGRRVLLSLFINTTTYLRTMNTCKGLSHKDALFAA